MEYCLKNAFCILWRFCLDVGCVWWIGSLAGYIRPYQLPTGDNQGEARIAVAVIYITMPRWVQLEIRLKINTKPCQIWYNFFYLELHLGEISVNWVRCGMHEPTSQTHLIFTLKTLMFRSKKWGKPFSSFWENKNSVIRLFLFTL